MTVLSRASGAFSLAVLGALVAACSAAPDADRVGSSAEAVASTTSTFLVPNADDVRVACRSTWGTRFCADADARAAGQACVAALVASGKAPSCAGDPSSCFRTQTLSEPCTAREPAYPSAASCDAPRPHNCAFYSQCVESGSACGDSGYALGYGEKYCTHFLVDDKFTPAGVAWRDKVMQCLQRALVPISESAPVACDTILNDAFDSHPHCYTSSPSICFLPASDIASVLGTIDGKDLLSLRSAKQMATVATTCVGQLLGGLFGGHAGRLALPVELQSDEAIQAHVTMWRAIQANGEALSRDAQ